MDDDILDAMFNIIAMYRNLKKNNQRRWKIRPINRDWAVNGYNANVFLNIKQQDQEQFFLHTRMTAEIYDLLFSLVGPQLHKPRQRILPEERLSLTLLYLAHGVPLQNIAWSYKLGKTTVRNIILETCEILWKILSPIYVSNPTESQYKDIAKDFFEQWNMPNYVGAIDGKHIAIKCPAKSGSAFFNYKKFFSIVLMAACDAKYTFTAISIGGYGSQSDGGIFRYSPFGQALISEQLPLPPDVPFSSKSTKKFPHFFVGDAAFPLRRNLMKPYSGINLDETKTIFNYRLSRARRVIENSFGILAARWRILRTTIECSPENCESIVLACIALHNFIMLNDKQRWYCPENYVDSEGPNGSLSNGGWRIELQNHGSFKSVTTFDRRGPVAAFNIRDELARYFMNEGAIPFQNIYSSRT